MALNDEERTRIVVYCTAEERKLIKMKAADTGMNMTQFILYLVKLWKLDN